MATPTSPNVIQQLIDNAMENEQSLVQWLGNGGLEQVLSALNQNIVYRGIMAFSTSSSMALSGGGDSQYAICLNDGVGLNFYKYFPNVDSTVSGAITSAEGGQWRPILAINNSPYTDPNIYGSATEEVFSASSYVTISITQPNTNYIVLVSGLNEYSMTNYVKRKLTTSFEIYFDIGESAGATVSFDYVLIPQP